MKVIHLKKIKKKVDISFVYGHGDKADSGR